MMLTKFRTKKRNFPIGFPCYNWDANPLLFLAKYNCDLNAHQRQMQHDLGSISLQILLICLLFTYFRSPRLFRLDNKLLCCGSCSKISWGINHHRFHLFPLGLFMNHQLFEASGCNATGLFWGYLVLLNENHNSDLIDQSISNLAD